MFNLIFKIMKKLLIVFLSLLTLASFAQKGRFNNAHLNMDFPGYLVNDKGDTVKGSFRIFLPEIMQSGCQMKDMSGNSLYGNSWNNVICYEIENDTRWYSTKLTTLKAPDDPKRIGNSEETFVLVVEKGPITLFDYVFADASATPERHENKSYMQLPTNEVIDVSGLLLGFAKKMPGYVKDFPELAAKISGKEKGYGVGGLNAIIREYNEWYMAKNPGFSIIKK